MPAAIDPEIREAVASAIVAGAGTVSCRKIASDHGVSPFTVSKIAKEIGQPDAFKRAQTKNATRARTADMASRRAGLAEKMLDLAEHIAARATASYTVIVATKDDVFREVLDEPPLSEVRQAMTAVGIAIDKHIALIRFDTKDGGNQAAYALVDALVAGFGLHPGDDVDDGYPVPLPGPEQLADDEPGEAVP